MSESWREKAGSLFDTFKREAIGDQAMVASNHPIATAAGLEMLAIGGNAVDAAVAVAFTLTVVEPMMIGIFGAGFINICRAGTREFVTVDNYAVAPKAATIDMFEPLSEDWPGYLETRNQANSVGYLAVGVPGALMGWCHVEEKYGTLGLDTVMQPAIRHATRGFPASQYLVDIIRSSQSDLERFPATAEVFLPGGSAPKTGQLIVQKDYARTLLAICVGGPEVLYRGTIGEMVVDDIAKNGGIITGDDLSSYEILHRAPVRQTYRDYEVVSVPPTSSGGTHILQVLNLLEGFNIESSGFGTVETIHLIAEALKISFADRFEFMGDPAFIDVPVGKLISKKYASSRRAEINLTRARKFKPGNPSSCINESKDTTHITVADSDGNVVSMTQTLHAAFGSKVTVPGTGIILNNNMYIFDPHPGNANSIAPGKRMLSSMSPTILLKNGDPFMALGTPGGTKIFPAVLQAIINVVDHGMTLQEAVEAPRIWTQGQTLEVEEGISPAIRSGLKKLGHEIEIVNKVAGGMNGINYDQGCGLIHGAACWRADGSAMGMSGGAARGIGDAMYEI